MEHLEEDHFIHQLARRLDDRGGGLVEYALLTSLIALACIAAMSFFSEVTSEKITYSCESIAGAGGGDIDGCS